MRIIAFITEAAPVERILTHIGEPPRPAPITPACGPHAWDDAPEPMPDWGLLQQPESDFEPRSSLSGALRRRCSPQHPETRAPAPRATSVSTAVGR
jgi:hypothetical protein